MLTNIDGSYSELYQITTDPLEENDLSKDQPEVVDSFLSKLNTWKATLPEKPEGDVFSEERDAL